MKSQHWAYFAGVLLAGAMVASGQFAPDGTAAARPAPTTAEAGPAKYDPPKQQVLFEALWARRTMFSNRNYKLLVVELLSPKTLPEGATASVNLKVKVLADLRGTDEEFEPFELSTRVNVSPTWPLAPDLTNRYYLATVYGPPNSKRTTWRLNRMFNISPRLVEGRMTNVIYYLLPIDDPTTVQALAGLVFGPKSDGEDADSFERMLAMIGGDDKNTRGFAASYASVNGWGYSGAKDQAHQPDALARVLLATTDEATRGRLAGAYVTAKADLLPRDATLLSKLFHHPDPNVYTPVLRYNLVYAAGRSKDLAGLLRKLLTAPGPMRLDALRGLAGWGEPAMILADEVEAIARERESLKVTTSERLVALQALLEAKAPDATELVLATVGSVPSAVALQYAVDQRLYAVAPAIIEAVRAGGLEATPAHLVALSLLTRHFPGGEFKQFDDWWRGLEKAGRAKDMVATGFADPEEDAEARRLIAELGSASFSERSAAREKLSGMGALVLPALLAATKHEDPEVADVADQLVADVEATFKTHRDALNLAVRAERSSALPLTMNAPRPKSKGAIVPGGGIRLDPVIIKREAVLKEKK